MKRFNFSGIQRLGRALMLPIAVLPAAALLLRFGQGDLLDLPFMAAAGAAIFDNLGLLFAVGIAVGLARENQGAAGLAGAVGFFVIIKGAGALLEVPSEFVEAGSSAVWLAKEASRMSIPAGILSGLSAGWLYNRYYAIRMPDCLSFFGGRRFVPIATGFLCLGWAVLFGKAWPLLGSGLDGLSVVLVETGNVGLFVYGVLNRLLVVTGLHHILNNIIWFLHGSFAVVQDGATMIVTGDLNRFFAGDPTAGAFMSGFFPVMMFGLPGACLAMYRNARPEKRGAAGGLLLSMALTSFLTGITEPIEFAFMFLAPALYALHALLTGAALVVMNMLGVKLGFGFSAGLIDYAINFGISTEPLYLIPVGAAYFVLYFCVFSIAIRCFNLRTPGREDDGGAGEDGEEALAEASGGPGGPGIAAVPDGSGLAAAPDMADMADMPGMPGIPDMPDSLTDKTIAPRLLAALGGSGNVLGLGVSDTRLRFVLADCMTVDRGLLRELGAQGFALPERDVLEVVFGPEAGAFAAALSPLLKGIGSAPSPIAPSPVKAAKAAKPASELERLAAALGGPDNITSIDACATRLRLTVARDQDVDEKALASAGALGVVRPGPGTVQVVLGPKADVVSTELRALLRQSADKAPPPAQEKKPAKPASELERLAAALGGPDNITSIDACATRLRLTVARDQDVDEKALKAAGALGVVRPGSGTVQVVLGPKADVVSTELRALLRDGAK